jgi:hypothetical protein
VRRLPPPWTTETDACFIVRDANGQALGYFHRVVCLHARARPRASFDSADRHHHQTMGTVKLELLRVLLDLGYYTVHMTKGNMIAINSLADDWRQL